MCLCKPCTETIDVALIKWRSAKSIATVNRECRCLTARTELCVLVVKNQEVRCSNFGQSQAKLT
jgi:hypothetical protein